MSARCTALVFLLAGACVDTKGRFDAYNERFEDYQKRLEDQERDAAVVDAAACQPPSVDEVAGLYLYAFASALDKTKPILMSLTLAPIKGSKTELQATFQALTVEGLKPSGDKIRTTVAFKGTSFTFEKVGLVVPADANPLNPLDANAEVTLTGTLCAAAKDEKIAFICGDAEGRLTDPLVVPLDGSEFGALRVEEGDPWPEPVSTCAMGEKLP